MFRLLKLSCVLMLLLWQAQSNASPEGDQLLLKWQRETHSDTSSEAEKHIRKFYFKSEDILSWQDDPIEMGESGQAEAFIKNFNAQTGHNFKSLPPQPGITFKLVQSKANELKTLTEEIADPVNTDKNLILYFNDLEISRLRVATPMGSDGFDLKMPPDRLRKLKSSLPKDKYFPRDALKASGHVF